MAAMKNQEIKPVIKIEEQKDNWLINAKIKGRNIEVSVSTKAIIPELSIKMS